LALSVHLTRVLAGNWALLNQCTLITAQLQLRQLRIENNLKQPLKVVQILQRKELQLKTI
jgi:hypothetical protein